jgi:hypothetical protein
MRLIESESGDTGVKGPKSFKEEAEKGKNLAMQFALYLK